MGNAPSELRGTVKSAERHIFVSSPKSDWAPRIEKGGGYLEHFASLLEEFSRKQEEVVRLTAFHDPDYDGVPIALVFPDGIGYRLKEKRIESWLRALARGKRVDEAYAPFLISGTQVFVCTHGTRDERCGDCGPPLIAELEREIQRLELGSVQIRACSHIGGHRYAGNVLVYPRGDWYGYVEPEDVAELLETVVLKREVLPSLWRGRFGLTPKEQLALGETALVGSCR